MGSQTARAISRPDVWLFRPSAVSSSSIDIIVFKAKVVLSRASGLVDRGWSERDGPCSEFSCKWGSTLFPFRRDGLCRKIDEWLRQPSCWQGSLEDEQMTAGWPASDAQATGWTCGQAVRRPDNQAARQPRSWGEEDMQMSG